jgi:hypothetical protein
MKTYTLQEPNDVKKICKPIEYIKNKDCWECVSHKISVSGYPRVCRSNYPQARGNKGKGLTVTHYVWFITHGEAIPNGVVVRHKCDNSLCINPEHLELGTHQDNMDDMKRRKRHKTVNAPTLTVEQALHIKRIFHSQPDKTAADVARELGHDEGTIRSIKNGRTWSHIDPDMDEKYIPFVPKGNKTLSYKERYEVVLLLMEGKLTQVVIAERFNTTVRIIENIQQKRKNGGFGEEFM